jgi:mannose-6-phosphate isomerase-like protein (cupin superfamily)
VLWWKLTTRTSKIVAFKRRSSPETTLDVFGVDVTFLVENEHTAGRFGMFEYVSKPGHEAPPHWHEHEDEVSYIIEGHFEMYCGDQVLQVEAGESRGAREPSRLRLPRHSVGWDTNMQL